MKRIFILLFLLIPGIGQGQDRDTIEKVFQNTPLVEVIQYLEETFALQFSYRDNNIIEEKINIQVKDFGLDSLLQKIFNQTKLSYHYVDKSSLILTKKEIEPTKSIELCGFVKDLESEEALVGASVWIKNKSIGTSTDISGAFLFSFPISKKDTMIISYLGYKQLFVPAEEMIKFPCHTYKLSFQQHEIENVVVREYLTGGISMPNGGTLIQVDPIQLPPIPGTVEPDIFHSLQLIPGINAPYETASGIYIRGGTPDQNLILWDDIPIYHTGHMFGMISSLNPYMIKDVKVYRSGIAAQYGGRASSVIDISTNDLAPKKWIGNAGFNLTHLHLHSEVPLWKNSGLQLSIRSNISETLSTPTFRRYAEKVFQGSKVDFNSPTPLQNIKNKFLISDLQLKWLWNPGKNKISISSFSGRNDLDYSSDIGTVFFAKDQLKQENIGLNFSWVRNWSHNFQSKISSYRSDYTYDYSIEASLFQNIDSILFTGLRKNILLDNGTKLINKWTPAPSHIVEFGYQHTQQDIEITIANDNVNLVELDQSAFGSNTHNLFADYSFKTEDLTLNAGLRYQNERSLRANFFAPRMSIHTKVSDELELKMSSSKQFQFISQLIILELNDIGVGNELWIASGNGGIPVIESTQWAGGLIFQKKGWTIDVEGYVKELSGITTISKGFGSVPEQAFSQGNSKIRGLDILAKRRVRNWRSWLSYTFAKADYDFDQVQTSVFPASHDIRHSLQWVFMLDAHPFELSMGWQLKSGLPYTPQNGIDSIIQDNGTTEYLIQYRDQNSARLKPYHKLDASIVYHFNQHKKIRGVLGLSLLNIYGRQNELGRNFLLDTSNNANLPELVNVDRAGLKFTPNFVVKINW